MAIDYVGGPLRHRGKAGFPGCFVDHGACTNWENNELLACGVPWLLRVADHEAALLGPNLFSRLVHTVSRWAVSGVVETRAWTADKQPVALLAKK